MERRALIDVLDSPEPRLDFLSILDHAIDADEIGAVAVTLRYVPDRFNIESASWQRYLAALAANPGPSLEALAARILSDVNDVVIARWMEVSAALQDDRGTHSVVISDCQPGWQNEELLTRLVRLGDAKSWN